MIKVHVVVFSVWNRFSPSLLSKSQEMILVVNPSTYSLPKFIHIYFHTGKQSKMNIFTAGFVQLIESVAVAEILETEGNLINYFKKLAPSEGTPQGITKEVIDTFIKSCGKYLIHKKGISSKIRA